MADQLNHLIKVAARPSIQLRVIPFDIGGHSVINGSFVLLEFPDGRPVVHSEQLRSGLFVDQPIDVDPYLRAVASLDAVALDPMQSVRMIEHLAASHK